MDYNRLTKNQLISILDNIINALDGEDANDKIVNEKGELESLIGTLPSLLLNKKYFEKNQDLADFGIQLGIHIPSPHKKKKEELIGRIISSISIFDKKKIKRLNSIISKMRSSKTEHSDFFSNWNDAIKNMKL